MQIIDITFDLKLLFLDINLKYEDWGYTQTELLKRNYSVVDNLQLNFEQKTKLRNFGLNHIQQYYFKMDNILNEDQKIEEVILEILMSQNKFPQRYHFSELVNLS